MALDALSPLKEATVGSMTAPSFNFGGVGIIWVIGFFVGIAIVSIIVALLWFFWREKKQWTINTRVHYENPTIDGVSLGNGVPTKRVRFKDGKVVYLYKYPIQGYTISPELLVWTRPREHDILVTQDKKLFCIVGIENIDIERKKLNVDISHPDIETDRQDLQHHIDSKKYDDPNEKLRLIAKIAVWVFVMVTIIVLAVLGGKYYIDGKNADLARDQLNLQVSESQAKVIESVNTFTVILDELMPELEKLKGTQNLVFVNRST